MQTKNLLLSVALVAICSCGGADRYKDSSLSIESRVEDLLSKMTIEEKAAQLDMLRSQDVLIDKATLNEENLKEYAERLPLGSIRDFYPYSATIANEFQRNAIERSRLGIPYIFIEEGLHGYRNGVGFPIPLGNAATWDTLLVNKIGRVIGRDARAHGVHFILGPNLDLSREIRWGRVEETFGEDSYLSSRLAVNHIKGMQGGSLTADSAVVAEPKHYAVHGIPENGMNSAPAHMGERQMRTDYLYVFEKAVKEGGAKGIMAAYHEIDGVPCASNEWLLRDVLRDEWGFDGFVVSDLGAVHQQITSHQTAANGKEAIVASINAGLNMQFYDFPYEEFQTTIIESVKDGSISMATLDKAVGDVLRVKFMLGLFDNPYTDTTLVAKRVQNKESRDLALEVASSSMVLLKNDGTLPLSNDVKRITLVGNLADIELHGGYSPGGVDGVTVLEGLQNRFGENVEIDYITTDISKNFSAISKNILSTASGEQGLKQEFFNSSDLEGAPVYTTVSSDLSPYWHNLSPAPGVREDEFSVRWSGYIDVPFDGLFEFSMVADDRIRLFIDDEIVVDNWDYKMCNVTNYGSAKLKKGKRAFRMEFSDKDQYAAIRALWRAVEVGSDYSLYDRITASARRSDAVILVVGESPDEVGEGKDKSNVTLSSFDEMMVRAAVASGKPTATVLVNGRPLVLTAIADVAPAILESWYGGQFAGDAICNVLFGDFNPCGHLTMTFPRDQNMMPSYYSRRPTSARKYVDGDGTEVLYGFGHGLSYTTFDYANLEVSPKDGSITGSVTVSLDVTNSGDRDGADVVQLYMRDVVSSVTTPLIALKGFSKLYLKAGETKRVTMELHPEHFSLINRKMERLVEPGEFIIYIGKSSQELVMQESITLK